jgi:hypothetical protein
MMWLISDFEAATFIAIVAVMAALALVVAVAAWSAPGGGLDRRQLDAIDLSPLAEGSREASVKRSTVKQEEDPTAARAQTLWSLTAINPGDAGIRACLNIRDSITR